MKTLLIVAPLSLLLFISCTSSTKPDAGASASVGKKTKCWAMFDTLVHVVDARVPELRTIGAAYIERETRGAKRLVYYIRRCPVPIEGDTLSTHYYELHAGQGGADEFPDAWYKFYVRDDLRTVLLYDSGAGRLVTVEAARKLPAWQAAWDERR